MADQTLYKTGYDQYLKRNVFSLSETYDSVSIGDLLSEGAISVGGSAGIGTLSDGLIFPTIGPGSLLDIQNWSFSGTFSATDSDTVAWTAGTLSFADGTTFAIAAGNTGNMTALTYIYFSKATSTTVLQVTTDNTAAVYGGNKVMLAVAKNETGANATFQAMGGKGIGSIVTTDNFVANTISGNVLTINTVTAAKMSVTSLSAISANMGTVTSGVFKGSPNTWFGAIADGSGISLNGETDLNNIFFRRTSDSAVFFRVNYGGASSITFDSVSGVMEVKGKLIMGSGSTLSADYITSGTLIGRTITNVAGTGPRFIIDGNNMAYYDGSGFPFWVAFVPGSGLGDAGDMRIGGASKYMHWDQSAGTLSIRGTLNADDISAGTLTGRVVQSTSGNGRIVLNTDDRLYFYDGAGAVQGTMYGSTNDFVMVAADDLLFYVNGGTEYIKMGAAYMYPGVDYGIDLGEDSHRWGTVKAYGYTAVGHAGHSQGGELSYAVACDFRDSSGSMSFKQRTITVCGGLITAVSVKSDWIAFE